MKWQYSARQTWLALAVSVLAVTLAACSGASPQSAASSGGSLTIIEHQQARADVLKKLLPQFESAMAAKGQHIHVKLVEDILPDSNFQTVLTQDYNAGTAADVSDIPLAWVPGYADAGYLLNLAPYLAKWPGWRQFYPAVKSQTIGAKGAVYGLVHGASTQQLFYRADVLKKLGISTQAPQTWTQLIARLQAIKAKTGVPPLVVPAGTAWAAPEQGLFNVLLGTGSQFYNQNTKKWLVKSQGLNYTFNLLYKLKQQGLIPTQDLLNPNPWQPTKYQAFVKGTLPVAFQGTWGWKFDWGPSGTAPIPNLAAKVKTWRYPAMQGSPYVNASDGWVWAISASSKHTKAAVELSEWLTTGKPLAEMLVAVGVASPRSGLDNVAPYRGQTQLLNAEHLFSAAKAFKPESGQAQIDEAFERANEAILTGQANGDQAATMFAQQATQLLGPGKVQS